MISIKKQIKYLAVRIDETAGILNCVGSKLAPSLSFSFFQQLQQHK